MFGRKPSGPPDPSSKPPKTGIEISPDALRTLVKGTIYVIAILAVVELAKLGADPTVLAPILKFLKL